MNQTQIDILANAITGYCEDLNESTDDEQKAEIDAAWAAMLAEVDIVPAVPAEKLSIYARLVAAGVQIENHYSDIHTPDTPETRELLRQAAREGVPGAAPAPFRNAINGEAWLDIPFAYEPWWADAEKTVESWAAGVTR